VSPVKYELGFYIPENDILHSHGRENLKSYKEGSIPRVRISFGQSTDNASHVLGKLLCCMS
jgi:hypothetical protein